MSHHKNQQDGHQDIFEDRKQFQIERIILFSDAVFAIAITLLVIEIKVPELKEPVAYSELIHSLWEKLRDILAYLLSFAVIGQFWSNHHRIFRYVNNYDGGLIWLNLLMLFFIALMPFTTFLNMRYGNFSIIWFYYSLNMFFIALSMVFLWMYLQKKPSFCTIAHDKALLSHYKLRALVTTIIFLLGGLMAFVPNHFAEVFSRFFFILIFPVLAIVNRRYKKKAAIKK